jgi:hypothetical protein
MERSNPPCRLEHRECDDDLLRHLLLVLLCLVTKSRSVGCTPLDTAVRWLRADMHLVRDHVGPGRLVCRLGAFICSSFDAGADGIDAADTLLALALARQDTQPCKGILELRACVRETPRPAARNFTNAARSYIAQERIDALVRVAASCAVRRDSRVCVTWEDGTTRTLDAHIAPASNALCTC